MDNGYEFLHEPQPDSSEDYLREQEEYCVRAALDIASYVETGGLSEVNALLEKQGYKLIRLSDVVPV